jgi:NADPH:quinone reductase
VNDPVPDIMTAIEIRAPGDPEVLVPVERPVPMPGPGEVLIRVAAAGVNRPDVLQRRGFYAPPPGASDLPGLEIAGTVAAAGADAAHLIGTNVCALVAGGGYAQYCVAPAGTCLPVPDGLSLTEAAALPETVFTVWTNLFERGFAADGDWVLVHGGTSGIGTTAIALGALFGVKVIVTCGSDDKCSAARRLGAAAAIDYRTADFAEETRRLTGGAGVAVVLDMVGGDYVPRNIAALADDGRHVSIATQRGMTAEVNFMDVMRRRLTLTGSTLRPRSVAFKSAVADELRRQVWPFVVSGQFRPVMDRCFPLDQAAAAHVRMESGDHLGKIVLTVDHAA